MHRMRGSWVAIAAVLVSTVEAGAQPADAPAGSDQCLQAFGDAQRLQREGKLKARRAQLLVCAQAGCPEIVTAKCSEWLQDAAKTQPSVLVVITDAAGVDVIDATITIDGEAIPSEQKGRPIEIDPGTHEIVVQSASKKASTKRSVVVAEGEQGRRVEIRFEAPLPPKKTDPKPKPVDPRIPAERVHPFTWVAFNMAFVSGVAGAVTGGLALARSSELEEACGGSTCTEAQRDLYDEGVALATASTATLIIAGVAAAAGFITLPLLYDRSERAPALKVRASIGPGSAGVEGRF